MTPRVSAPVSARRSTGAASGTSSPFAAMAVRRRSAMRRSAIAANPSAAILACFGADCLGVEGAEPLVSLRVAPRGMLSRSVTVASQPCGRPQSGSRGSRTGGPRRRGGREPSQPGRRARVPPDKGRSRLWLHAQRSWEPPESLGGVQPDPKCQLAVSVVVNLIKKIMLELR